MNDKTQALIELTWHLAHANRLELPTATLYEQAIEHLLGGQPMAIRTDLNRYDFRTINVHLDTNTNEWRADWHTYQMLVPVIGTDTFPNIPWIIKDVSQRLEAAGYALASFQCTCPTCQGEPAKPVQAFIERMYTRRNETIADLTRATYQKLIDIAEKHQVSYGEENIPELIEYLDGLAAHPDLDIQAVKIVKFQANDLQRRLENRMSREADEQAQREAEVKALKRQQAIAQQ